MFFSVKQIVNAILWIIQVPSSNVSQLDCTKTDDLDSWCLDVLPWPIEIMEIYFHFYFARKFWIINLRSLTILFPTLRLDLSSHVRAVCLCCCLELKLDPRKEDRRLTLVRASHLCMGRLRFLQLLLSRWSIVERTKNSMTIGWSLTNHQSSCNVDLSRNGEELIS